jgi:hypothetical protein
MLDLCFRQNNPVLVDAVAHGLARHPSSLQDLSAKDLQNFLASSGHASLTIMDLIFQPLRRFQFWEQARNSDKLKLTLRRCAFISGGTQMRVKEGPSFAKMHAHLESHQEPDERMLEFIEGIAPQQPLQRSEPYVQVAFQKCIVKKMHRDLKVLLAIISCPHKEIFNTFGAKVLVELKWQQEWFATAVQATVSFLEVVNLTGINIALNLENQEEAESQVKVQACAALGVLVFAFFLETIRLIGYFSACLGAFYVKSPSIWLSWLTLMASIFTITDAMYNGYAASEDPVFRMTLGGVICLKWLKFAAQLRSFKFFGMHLLPIAKTASKSVSFIGVLAILFLASVNMFYALGLHDLDEIIFFVYRIVAIGDVPKFDILVNGNRQYALVVRLMVLGMSLFVGIAALNIFIAMLCIAYEEANEDAARDLLHMRANSALQYQAQKRGLQTIVCRRRWRRRRGLARGQSSLEKSVAIAVGLDDDDSFGYLWVATPEDEDESSTLQMSADPETPC